ncbi:MAG: DUF1684 domain-containing protein [Cyclobacteriaceae bacterium]|nr:DUF1684 domain-containing protein [Cyclobacteriaceae bacterium]
MKTRHIILIVIAAALAGTIFYTATDHSGEDNWRKELLQEREEKDLFMRNSDESPFRQDSTQSFTELSWYSPDLKYRVIANLEPADKQLITLNTSDGQLQQYARYAWATFDLDDFRCKLLLLEPLGMGASRDMLFLPFADATSAMDTYGAGRYLELKKVPGAGTITLDFNKAYNPYCAYVESYSCPLPPSENILKVPIQAGEKNYHP